MNDYQYIQIKKHLEAGNPITQEEAREKFACWRLSHQIYKLRNEGLPIETKMITTKNSFGQRVTFAQYILGKREGEE